MTPHEMTPDDSLVSARDGVASKVVETLLDASRRVDVASDFTDSYRNSENCFSDTLRDELREANVNANREVSYINAPRKKCDLFAEIHGTRVYLEVKLLYPNYWKKSARYKQRLFDPLIISGNTRETHSAARDLEKLATLQLSRPDYLGILIVSSCTERYDSKEDFATFSRLAQLDDQPWINGRLDFPNSHHQGFYLDARAWIVSAEEIGGWWDRVGHLFDA